MFFRLKADHVITWTLRPSTVSYSTSGFCIPILGGAFMFIPQLSEACVYAVSQALRSMCSVCQETKHSRDSQTPGRRLPIILSFVLFRKYTRSLSSGSSAAAADAAAIEYCPWCYHYHHHSSYITLLLYLVVEPAWLQNLFESCMRLKLRRFSCQLLTQRPTQFDE